MEEIIKLSFNEDLLNWIKYAEIPIIIGSVGIIIRLIRYINNELNYLKTQVAKNLIIVNRNLADYKLEVSKEYVSITYLKDVETRLTSFLLRIERKLDEEIKSNVR